jgi:hypothetical protein
LFAYFPKIYIEKKESLGRRDETELLTGEEEF